MRKKLTKAQKAKNKALYNYIRKQWIKANEKTDLKISYKEFKRMAISQATAYDLSIKEGAKKYAHSTRFMEREDIGKENLLEGLKNEFPDTYKELRSKMGRFDKGETMMSRLSWDDNKQMYKFTNNSGDVFWVDISNSPKAAYII